MARTHGACAREAEIQDFHGYGSDAALAIVLEIRFEKLRMSFLDGCHCRWNCDGSWCARNGIGICWPCVLEGESKKKSEMALVTPRVKQPAR